MTNLPTFPNSIDLPTNEVLEIAKDYQTIWLYDNIVSMEQLKSRTKKIKELTICESESCMAVYISNC